MVKRKRTVPLQVTILLVLLLCLIPLLAWFQYQWTGVVSVSEEGRMRENLRATGMQFMMALENEVTVIHDMLEAERGAASVGDTTSFVEQAVQFWVGNTAYPALLRSVSVVPLRDSPSGSLLQSLGKTPGDLVVHEYVRDSSGEFSWRQGTLAQSDPAVLAAILDMPILKAETSSDSEGRTRVTTIISKRDGSKDTRADGPFRDRGSPFIIPRLVGLSPNPPVLVISRIEPETIIKTILPDLTKRYFALPDGLAGYSLTVYERSNQRLVWKSDPGATVDTATGNSQPDLVLPLLGSWRPDFLVTTRSPDARSPDFPRIRYWLQSNDRPPPAIDHAAWVLEVRRTSGSFEEAAARIRWLNLGGSLGLLLLITLGLAYLYRLYRQSRVVVRTQEDFVATVSHELKTPLSVLRSAAENLREGVVTDVEHTKRYGERMVNEAERLLQMTENVLRYARLEAGELHLGSGGQEFDLAQLVRETVQDWKGEFSRAGAELQFHNAVLDDTRCSGDPQAIRALVGNLLSNARRYGVPEDGDGRVEVRLGQWVEEAHWHWLPPRKTARRKWFILAVTDNGPGIARADQKRLFQPFARPEGSPTGGIGLGLSLVRRIAVAHGGRVRVEGPRKRGHRNRVGLHAGKTGVSFIVELPHPDRHPGIAPEPQGGQP